ncbi:alpha-ketoacid dehydrogenase subunit beta [[Clostridium] innocuum]|nr:alpha-ketoacid dehydrogenase subunit beta [[Clostridium] innocuum]MCR0443847.1 alpha-ketoacid dehydrogenase subunit beta [[Clostridium] innocuum]
MSRELREVYVSTVLDIAQKDPNVYVLEADLSASMGTKKIKDKLKDHYIDVGIAEGQEICTAAGIAAAGGIAFVHSFAAFITRRAYDQIFISLAYAQQHAILVGSDAGISAESNGGTHMCFEDMAIMRAIPHCNVYDVSDAQQFAAILRHCYETKGLHYIRTARKKVPDLYDDDLNIEKGYHILKEGSAATLFTTGILTSEAIAASQLLKDKGIDLAVIDIHSVKPLPASIVISAADKGKIFTLENHNVTGGLGSAILEALAETKPAYVYRLGIQEAFGQVGGLLYLKKAYGLDAESIAEYVSKKL